jgi:hypothetical protein
VPQQIDVASGQPIMPVKNVDTGIMQPVDIQNRLAVTIQTHNAVSVGATSWSLQSGNWIDTNGFTEIGVTLVNSGTTNISLQILWSNDGSTQHGLDNVKSNVGGDTTYAGGVSTRARYAKVNLYNYDAASKTMSAWAYLKA